jgi:CDGSH-type Zn-finger protein
MDPKIADKKPAVVELEPGEYKWCACGLSKDKVFCDHSHKGTGLHSVRFTVEEKKKVALCQCKQTKNPPFCDGAHGKLRRYD